jgi:hypothetical protein
MNEKIIKYIEHMNEPELRSALIRLAHDKPEHTTAVINMLYRIDSGTIVMEEARRFIRGQVLN